MGLQTCVKRKKEFVNLQNKKEFDQCCKYFSVNQTIKA